jgi:hypothetical protein
MTTSNSLDITAPPATWYARMEYVRTFGPAPNEADWGAFLAWKLKRVCLALAAGLPEEATREVTGVAFTPKATPAGDWLAFTQETVWGCWLELVVPQPSADPSRVPRAIALLREQQQAQEMAFFQSQPEGHSARDAALELMALYFLGAAAEKLAQSRHAAVPSRDGMVRVTEYFERALRVLLKGKQCVTLELLDLLMFSCSPLAREGVEGVAG